MQTKGSVYKVILGIDASNIRAGGGLTHLKQLLNNIHVYESGFSKIVIWSSNTTLNKLQDHEWLIKKTHILINKKSFFTLLWQLFFFTRNAKNENCFLVFAPGGTFLSSFKPYVTMSQNMLPFELSEAFRYKSWLTRFRFLMLRMTQSISFKRATAMIYISNYAQNTINKLINMKNKPYRIIHHGVYKGFLNEPSEQKDISCYHFDDPYKILYVSIVSAYKHQWNVAEAIIQLRKEGYPLELNLVGSLTKEGYPKLEKVLNKTENWQKYIKVYGSVPYEQLSLHYNKNNMFVFASSCENQPIILLEAMSAGLPIACSKKGPMPEVLKNNGVYFDPDDPLSIKSAILQLINNKEMRRRYAQGAYEEVKNYTWQECSNKTFEYLYEIALKTKNNG